MTFDTFLCPWRLFSRFHRWITKQEINDVRSANTTEARQICFRSHDQADSLLPRGTDSLISRRTGDQRCKVRSYVKLCGYVYGLAQMTGKGFVESGSGQFRDPSTDFANSRGRV
jgi:hypothetical protein